MAIVAVTVACARVDEGRPVAAPSGSPDRTSSLPTVSSVPPPVSAQPEPGVLPTQRNPLPANTVTCSPEARPSVSVAATIDDPAAPRITVGVPEGWSFTAGTADVAVTLQGPGGMTGAVSITPTTLDPEAAFRDYTDGVMAKSAMSTVSILPAELCDYSGQELTGTWSDGPDDSVEFVDRLVHIWTNGPDYLVAIHLEAPAGPSDPGSVAATVTDDVEVAIP